jgi:hypothetical protein
MSFGTVQAEKMTTESGYSLGAGNASSFKNRIINGGMVIDQRNAGSAVTANGAFPVDRFYTEYAMDGAYSGQRDTSAPAGFINSMKITTTTADASLSAGQYFLVGQKIEGLNIADLGWGSASAKPVTLSFWVRSSLTGTFSGSLRNSSGTRSYPFTYTISSADTWEQKSVSVAGDTSGTWLTTTGIGIDLDFSMGSGSTYSGTANAWAGANYVAATGAVSVIGTLNATWYITGVQLEVGTVATSFDFRSYGTELALCQRYYEKSYEIDVAPATNTYVGRGGAAAVAANSTQLDQSSSISFKVTKRSAPTMQYWRQQGTASVWSISGPGIGLFTTFNVATNTSSQTCFEVATQATTGVSGMTQYALYTVYGQWVASAEL